jgi:hypothetical protein
MTLQIAGPIGPFLDNVQQRQVPVVVMATCEYLSGGPPADPARDHHVQQQLLAAIRDVVARQMGSGALSFRHLGTGDVAAVVPEILAASGLERSGIRVGNLSMAFGIDGRAPHPGPPPGARPHAQQAPQMPEIEARIHIGGLKIKANSKGGIDTAGLQNQLVDKAKSQIIWWAIGAGILVVVLLGILGLGLYIWRSAVSTGSPSGSAAAAAAASWDGKTPFRCGANDKVAIANVKARVSGEPAITASGNCVLTLTNVDVTAPTAIEAAGNAVVTVQGGSLDGSAFAVHAAGGSKVTLTGTKVTGKAQAVGGAKITGP